MSVAVEHGYLQPGRYIINHDIMNCTADGVIGNHLYSGRALGLSEPWDMIQLHPDLKLLWPGISAHYGRIGLSHTEKVIWDLDPRALGTHPGYSPSVFYYGPHESRYWGDDGWLETVDYINSKNNFMLLAQELGMDVPATQCFERVNDITPSDIENFVYPCYLKAAVSVSGIGIYRCEDQFEFMEAQRRFDADTPVQVQEEIKTDSFLNMQYRVIGDAVIRLAASEQILDGFVHQGNRVPTSHEPWKSVDVMAQWLKDHGMKGIFAFDVAVLQTDRGLRFPVIECNPRFNGASYPTIIAHKLDIPEWSAISLSTRYRRLDDFDIQDLEFNMRTGKGAIIVNWGTILVGKLVVLLAGPVDYQEALAVELKRRLW